MGFINALAGATQGSVDYQKFMQQQAIQRQEQQMNAMKMQAFQQQQEQAQQDRASQENVARGMVGTQGMFNPVSIPPMPGQASQPQQQPQQQQSPDGLDASKVDPRMMAYLAKQNPQALQKGLSHFQQTSQPQPQIPPYQTMGGQQPQAQQQPAQIPEQPKYDWATMVKKLESMGITRPSEQMEVMEKQQGRMDTEAKQKLAYYKEMEMTMYRERMAGAAESRAKTGEKAESARESLIPSQIGKNEATAGATTAKTAAMPTAASGMSPDVVDYMAGQLAGGNTGVLTGFGRGAQGAKDLQAVRSRAVEILREQGVSPDEANAKVAQFGGEKSGARAMGTRGANLSIAANELKRFSDIALTASAKVGRTQFIPLNRAVLAVQQGSGSPDVAAFVAANESIINAFAQVAGRGTPTVAGMEHARTMLNTAQSPEQYDAVVKQLKVEAQAAISSVGEAQEQQTQRMSGKEKGPKSGTVENGYRFKGGDPAKQENWEKQ